MHPPPAPPFQREGWVLTKRQIGFITIACYESLPSLHAGRGRGWVPPNNTPRFIILLFIFMSGFFSPKPAISQENGKIWVDSVYNSLTIEQRIAQLMVIRAYSWKDSTYCDSLVQVVKKYNVGGVCFFKGSPVKQAILTNRLLKETQTPLLITIDAEWGIGMRLDSAFSFPRQMALGAMSDDSLIYEMGRMVGKS